MISVLIGLSESKAEQIRGVIGKDMEFHSYPNLNAFFADSKRFRELDKLFLWDSISVGTRPEVSDALARLAGICANLYHAPEVCFVEQDRSACAFVHENTLNVEHHMIVCCGGLNDMMPILGAFFTKSLSSLETSGVIHGVYTAADYQKDMEAITLTADFDGMDEFEMSGGGGASGGADAFDPNDLFGGDDDFGSAGSAATASEPDEFDMAGMFDDVPSQASDEAVPGGGVEGFDEFDGADNGPTVGGGFGGDEFEVTQQPVFEDVPPVSAAPVGGDEFSAVGASAQPTEISFDMPTGEVPMQEEATVTPDPTSRSGKDLMKGLKTLTHSQGRAIAVCGTADSGTTTVAYNMGVVLAGLGFRVLLVDLTGSSHGLSQISLDGFRMIPYDSMVVRNLIQGGLTSIGKPMVVRKNLAIACCGVGVDPYNVAEIYTEQQLYKVHNQLASKFDFIIYDMDLKDVLSFYKGFAVVGDTVCTFKGSMSGAMRMMCEFGNADDLDTSELILQSARFLPTQVVDATWSLGGAIVHGRKVSLKGVDTILDEILGGESDFDFNAVSLLPTFVYDPMVVRSECTKKAYVETSRGAMNYFMSVVGEVTGC